MPAVTKEVKFYNTFVLKGDQTGNSNWHIEESRIKGDFNGDSVDLGVQAHIVDKDYKNVSRENALIYSGIYNSRTGVNNTNQFSSGQNITRAVDIQYGSIQKLFAEDTNLNILQEEKVSRALIDKDAIYTAEGGRISVAADRVIIDIIPYGGNYGISKNPESFAHFAGRKYFTDKNKGAVLRLSRDGITEISSYGMRSYFRDNLKKADSIHGMWDMHSKDYVLSLQGSNVPDNYKTLTFDEKVNGWTSFHTYKPSGGGSLNSTFYTFYDGEVYKHYSNSDKNKYYGSSNADESNITLIFNQAPSVVKNFYIINYEGSNDWAVSNILSDTDTAQDIAAYAIANDDLIISGFKKMDNKYFSHLLNNSSVRENEVIFGEDIAGIKGFYNSLKLKTSSTSAKELFSVSTNYNISSY